MTQALRFLEFSFSVDKNGSITFEELDSEKLDVRPGDGFMAFVDPKTNEVTLRKIDLTAIEHVELHPVEEC